MNGEITQSSTWLQNILLQNPYPTTVSVKGKDIATSAEKEAKRILDLWGDTVLRLALCKTRNRADAEDVTQMVFMKFFQRQPAIENNEHLKAWLLRVTLTCCIDFQRSTWKTHRTLQPSDVEKSDAFSLSRDAVPFCDSESELTKASVAEAVASLPEKQRIAVHLFYFEDLPLKEVALVMDEKNSTVKSHLRRARIALKQLIGALS